jgi:hypothetical protein
MVGIGNSQLSVNLTTRDVHNNRLNQTANSMTSVNAGFVWNPTSKLIIRREETDKQNDDNLTFLFEYRALLNSRMQTLITQLSNALASDLEVAMSSSNSRWNNNRSAMNGNTTSTAQDAGAGRTAFNFMMGWTTTRAETNPAALNPATGADATRVEPDDAFDMRFNSAATGNIAARSIRVAGSATLTQADPGLIDVLSVTGINGIGTPNYLFANTDSDLQAGAGTAGNPENVLNNSFAGPLGIDAKTQQAKNLFQKVLFDAVASVEFRPVLSSGLFKNVIVSASASLASGSQAQASFSMTYNGTQDGGRLDISIDKFTAFFHS